ncbi:pectate lyase [Caulobacter sp. 17J80-11]|uniref:pectate lyase n=1 Tax=Caulobacter sp. 17J80-11 TaxID=2763502 RepID=UPI00165385D7|nr:pectate lyase [Caulobacter sp. 17J80-11]MBC6983157.1 pectate lyase [Caulobacter sp. 17J80-11]
MLDRRRLLAGASALTAMAALPARAAAPSRAEVLATMKRATAFMVDKVAYQGGYVWSYLPDFSRRWGELEAKPTMIWVQPPGTATVGHLFLDAFNVTGDADYLRAAEQAAGALIRGQHPSGGWNYLIDLAGEQSLRDWYATVGKNAWRLEEFQHYYGNATFDDAGTSEAMQLLLRLYAQTGDKRVKAALDRAIGFVLDSQLPVGGWPQRWPRAGEFSKQGRPDYTGFLTFNDDVAGENIKFLIMAWQVLGEPRLLDAVHRAMDSFVATQQPAPQAGWGLQHGPDLKPIGARTYEPTAVVTHTTANNLAQLMTFYELTGDARFLARVPEALDWLDGVALPEALRVDGRTHPTFVEPGTNRPLFLHRRGSNVTNGVYWADYDPANTVGHYSSQRKLDVAGLRRRYEALRATPPELASRGSPLKAGRSPLPRFFATRPVEVSDLNSNRGAPPAASSEAARVAELVAGLNAQGWWPTMLKSTSHPYRGDSPAEVAPGDFSRTLVGDATDTSPYVTDTPVVGISTGIYVQNMGVLIEHLASA